MHAAPKSKRCADCATLITGKATRCRFCFTLKQKRERVRGSNARMPMSGGEGHLYGAIVSFENAEARTLVLHRTGRVRDVIHETYRIATGLDQTFRIVSISTPNTVYADLQGMRHEQTGRVMVPEVTIAPKRMVHPRLCAELVC